MATESVEMLESGEETSSSIGSDASPNPGIVANPHENLDFSYDSVHEDDEEGAGSKSEDGEVTDDEEEAPKSEDDGEVLEDGEVNVPIVQKPDDSQEDSVEEGEVTDEEVISELDRKDNKPVCRFFSKGQCTWGNNCRFLHPGVTDKGLYTMFETVPPPPPRDLPSNESSRPTQMHGPPIIESAWERGLRHAKEIIKASAKRKETDVDFEEKKINLSLAGDEEIDKENNDYYVRKPELHVGKVDVLDPDYGVHSPIPSDFIRAPKIDPEFVRERVHRIKGAPPQDRVERSPPPRRMVRESELRKMEIEMMMGEDKRDGRRTDAYGRSIRPPQRDFRNARPRVQNSPERGFKRSRSSSRSSSSSSSSSSSKSSRRRQRYYSRGSDDSRSRKRKRSDSSASESSASRRRATSGTSTSRSRSKSANEEERGRRRRRTASSSATSRSSSSERARRFVRKAPPREPQTQASPKPVRIAPPLPHFDSGAQDAPPEHHGGRENTRWGQGQTYRRAPPASNRAPRYFQNPNIQHERPVGLVRERDLHNQGQYAAAPVQSPPPPASPTNSQKTPVPSPSSSPRRKTRYKREYSSDHELASVSRSRSRSYSRSNSGSERFRAKREERSSRSSSFSSSSRSRSRSRPLSPPASPVPAPVLRSRSTSSNRSAVQTIQNKPKGNQIKLTLKPRERVHNKHVIERLGGAEEEEKPTQGVGSSVDDPDSMVDQIASPSPPQDEDGEQRPSRREELLKQLKAVEEAIAKKRSKLDVSSK